MVYFIGFHGGFQSRPDLNFAFKSRRRVPKLFPLGIQLTLGDFLVQFEILDKIFLESFVLASGRYERRQRIVIIAVVVAGGGVCERVGNEYGIRVGRVE